MEKMLFWSLLLISMLLASGEELTIENYIIDIEENTLRSVAIVDKTSDELNLSGRSLRAIDKNAFDHSSELKILNLQNNSLSRLPEFVFINLTKLEHLSMAENEITKFENTFVGLNNLKTLNISYNPIKILKKSYMYGLTNLSEIFVEGLCLMGMSSGLFENPFLRDAELKKDNENKIKSKSRLENEETNLLVKENFTSVKICMENENFKFIDILNKDEILTNDCREAKINLQSETLALDDLGISTFEKNWYRLQAPSIITINLSKNNISKITSEMLNDLGDNIKNIDVSENKIKRLENGIIKNNWITTLDLSKNLLTKVEDNALRDTKLVNLLLSNNKLDSTRFMTSLPSTTNFVDLQSNKILEISSNSFAIGNQVKKLCLTNNKISRLSRRSLSKLSSLEHLDLSDNRINRLRSGCFEDLKALKILNLHNNSIDSVNVNSFQGLEDLEVLNLGRNKFKEITKDFGSSLPKTLLRLRIDHNEIKSLQPRSFVHVPKDTLSLNGNKITKMANGTFYLPNLTTLRLDENFIEELGGSAFLGLPNVKYLALQSNVIKKIAKGFASQLGSLESLNLSKNPIRKLENGAFFGIPKWSDCSIFLVDVPLEIIQGGLFDNFENN